MPEQQHVNLSSYMGVPCITIAGSVHAHNVGLSLLKNIGLGKLVAKSKDEYVQLALKLASDVLENEFAGPYVEVSCMRWAKIHPWIGGSVQKHVAQVLQW